jgi:hypothetical protein
MKKRTSHDLEVANKRGLLSLSSRLKLNDTLTKTLHSVLIRIYTSIA